MDVKIRNLLAVCENHEECLDEAFELLRSNESRPAVDGPDMFSHDLFVLCAEAAIQQGKILMARDSLKMYFGRIPPQNQFLGRAYLAQAQLLAPDSSENVEQLEKAVVFLLRAIKFAKENSRYYFIVYNASVLYWTFCRPFLRPGYKKYLAPSLLMVSRALDDTKDPDYEWRGTLMIALIESLLEAGKFKDAIDVSTNAASFTKRHVPHLFKEVFRLQILHDLVELPFLYRASRQSGDLNCFYRLQKFRAKITRGDAMSDPKGRIVKCLDQIMNRALDEEEDDEEESAISEAGKPKLGRKPAARPVAKLSKGKPGAGTPTGAGGSFHAYYETHLSLVEPEQQPTLLIDMFRLCLDQNYLDLAEMALNDLKSCSALTKADEVEVEILDSELMLRKLGDQEESLRKDIVQLRHKLVDRVEQALSNAVRLDDRDLVQAACTTLWNMCLPLLQPNLRAYVRRPLTLIANTLEDIQSLLRLLRCQVHTELAKCEEDVEQNQVAIQHINKAMLLDDEAVYLERHETSLTRLQMRTTLYQTPEDPLLLAAQIIEQAASTGSGTMTMRRAHLMKAGQALSPDAFSLVIEAESFNKVLAASGGAGQTGVLALTQPMGTKAMHYNTYIEKTQGHLKRVGNEQDRTRARLWADLAKTARKQGVWDICRVACRFCLLYDDGRWQTAKPLDEKTSKKKGTNASAEGTPAGDAGHQTIGSAKSDNSAHNEGGGGSSDEKTGAGSSAHLGADGDQAKKSSAGDAMTALGASADPKKSKDDDEMTTGSSAGVGKADTLYDKDLLRILAEVNFIYGEALVQLIRSEGLELNNMKSYPDDKSKRPKGYVPPRPDQDKNWIEYSNWISKLHSLVTQSFLRGADIGVELKEAWIVQSAVAYLWNYTSHMLSSNRHRELVGPFERLFECLKQVGFDNKAPMLVNLCTALATGLISAWIPKPVARPNTASTIRMGSTANKGGRAGPVGNQQKGGGGGPQSNSGGKKDESVKVPIDAKGMEEIKRAIAICEFAVKVTGGGGSPGSDSGLKGDAQPVTVSKNCEVGLSVRQPLLNVWVQAKQLASQSIGKGLGCDDEEANDGQKLATRVMVAVEMCSLNSNGLFEFRECPSLNELYAMSDACKWSDRNIQVHIWTRLACLSYDSRDFSLALKCCEQTLRVEEEAWLLKLKRNDHFKYQVFHERLSNAACIQGQCTRQLMQGNNPMRRKALNYFLNACKYGKKAGSYDLVMTGARHFWNTALPLVNSKLERELLQETLSTILKCINDTVNKEKERQLAAPKSDSADDTFLDTSRSQALTQVGGPKSSVSKDGPKVDQSSAGTAVNVSTQANILATMMQPSDTQKIGDPSEDLTLRAAMYGVLFLSFIDKKDYEGGLAAMDEAVNILPRTKHRLLVFKHRVMVKAKLGHNVSADIAKFKDESEDYVAYMWRRVALSSKKEPEQLSSFQNSIEALTLATHDWQKVDYVLELAEWLYVNEYPLSDSVDMFEWAINILLNMKFPLPSRLKTGGSKKASRKSTLAGKSTTRSDAAASNAVANVSQRNVHDPDQPPLKGEDFDKSGHELVSDDEDIDQEEEGDAFDATQFIPIVRKAEIGTHLVTLAMTIESVNGINQLELLMRTHLMLGSVLGASSNQFPHCVLMAYTCVMRMWQVTLMQGNRGRDERTAADGKSNSAKKKDGKKDAEKKKDEPVKGEKGGKGGAAGATARKTGPVDSIPETFEEWSLFEMPDNIRQICQSDMSGFCINKLTVNKPMLTIYYLLNLVDYVREMQLNYLAFPVLSLAKFIANDVLEKDCIAKIVRLKLIQVCYEINLVTSATFHETAAGNLIINEEEQAQVRTELAVMEEKLHQVMMEERRMRQSRKVMIDNSKLSAQTKILMLQRPDPQHSADSPTLSTSSVAALDVPFGEPLVLSGRKIGDVVFHENWIETAQFLIDQCQYQSARQFLSEANSASKRLDDISMQRKCLQLLSLMALKEGNPDQATKMLAQAQNLGGDPEFWFSATNILAECILLKREDIARFSKARYLVHLALDEFETLLSIQPNKKPLIKVLMAKLEMKLALIEYEHIMMGRNSSQTNPANNNSSTVNVDSVNTMQPKVHGALLEVIKRLEKVAQVFNSARKFIDEIYVTLQICHLYRRFAADCRGDEESRNDLLLRCHHVLRAECTKHQQQFDAISQLLPISELGSYSLPYGRALGEMQLLLCAVMLDLFHIHVNTEKRHTEMQRRKPSLVQFVEEFQRIEMSPVDFEDEMDLATVVNAVPHSVLSILQGALANHHITAHRHSSFRAKVMLLSGKFYSLQGLLASPDRVLQWQLHNMNVMSLLLSSQSQAAVDASKKKQPKEKESLAQMPTARDASSLSAANQNAAFVSTEVATAVASKLDLDTTRMDQQQESTAVVNPDGTQVEEENRDSALYKNRCERILRDKKAFMQHSLLYAQATELLSQSVQLALSSGDYALAGSAALEMVETVAQYDPNVASQYLALHQSCVVSCEARKLLELANSDTGYSYLHALLRQRQVVSEQNSNTSPTSDSGALLNNLTQQLTSFEAWRRTQVKSNHFEFTKDYPNSVNFIVIQHSPDKKFIYVGILDKPKSSGATKTKNATSNPTVVESKARVFRVAVVTGGGGAGRVKLEDLVDRVDKLQIWMKTYYLQRESRMSQQSYQANLMQSLHLDPDSESPRKSEDGNKSPGDERKRAAEEGARGESAAAGKLRLQVEFRDILEEDETDKTEEKVTEGQMKEGEEKENGNDQEEERESNGESEESDDWIQEDLKQEALLQAEFEKIVHDMELYLEPVSNILKHEFQSLADSNFMVVLLADMLLQRLPLEALMLLRENPNITGFSRDFSLQMFHNRFCADASEESSGEEGKDKKGKGEKGVAGAGGAAGKNAKAQKESKRPQVKVSSLDRDTSGGFMGVDVHSVSYIVDPLAEGSEYDEFKPEVALRGYMDNPTFSNKYMARWMGIMGGDKMPTNGEWVEMLRDCSAFLYYGLENLFSYVSVDRLLPLSLSQCHLLLLLDRVQSYPSYKRVSKENVNKTETQLQLEMPLNVCMLMSLIGVGTIMMNQWFCKSQDNKQRFDAIMKYLIDQGVPTGNLHKLLCYPPAMEKELPLGPTASMTNMDHPQPATPAEGDRSEARSAKSREGAQSGKGHHPKPNSGSQKSRPASSAKPGGPQPDVNMANGQIVNAPFEVPPAIYSNFNMTLFGLPSIVIT